MTGWRFQVLFLCRPTQWLWCDKEWCNSALGDSIYLRGLGRELRNILLQHKVVHEPVGDESEGESNEANGAAEDDPQGHETALLIPDGGGTDGIALRLSRRRRESVDMSGVQGFHLRNEYQINSVPSSFARLLFGVRGVSLSCLFVNSL